MAARKQRGQSDKPNADERLLQKLAGQREIFQQSLVDKAGLIQQAMKNAVVRVC